jgi:hypothetical protein
VVEGEKTQNFRYPKSREIRAPKPRWGEESDL